MTTAPSTSEPESDLKLHILADSGAPEGSTDYTTVIVLHGFVWHGGESPLLK